MKISSYKVRLFISTIGLFAIFALALVLIQRGQEKRLRMAAITERLRDYATMVHKVKDANPDISGAELIRYLPEDIRLSIIDKSGKVQYDSEQPEDGNFENHKNRPELRKAQTEGWGTNMRTSKSTHEQYLYYAHDFPNEYIRLAVPFYSSTYDFVKIDNSFLIYTIVLFLLIMFLVRYTSTRFSGSIESLRTFAEDVAKSKNGNISMPDFPDDELGEIGGIIADNYKRLQHNKVALSNERERLLQHIHNSREGICFFNKDGTQEFYNGLYLQYLHIITDQSDASPEEILRNPLFEPIASFIQEPPSEENSFETKIVTQGKTFSIKAIKAEDNTVEVIINDVTEQEKVQQLKQQLTGNITHELSTPVTGIRGSLETVLNTDLNMPEDKKRHFIQNAYNQSLLLSELIRDISLISKIEERSDMYHKTDIRLREVVAEVEHDLHDALEENGNIFVNNLPDSVLVAGNRTLLYSIFRNLTDNAIRYAGEGVKIEVSLNGEEGNFYRLSYSDNGVGIGDDKHLPKIFERFYRLEKGRSRNAGGSGLGLSIVRNAIVFHKGNIIAKNRKGGGLEFLFRLPKAKP